MPSTVRIAGVDEAFELTAEDDALIGTFRRDRLRDTGEIVVGPWVHRFDRYTPTDQSCFELREPDGTVLATAERDGIWRARWVIRAGPVEYELARPDFLRRTYLVRGLGDTGRIDRAGIGMPANVMTMPTGMRPELQCMALAVALAQWRRDRWR